PGTRYMALSIVARYPGRLRADLAWEGLLKGAGKPGFLPALVACTEYDFRERLNTIRCPTLIVWGENDSVIPVRDARALAQRIPGSRTVVMADTGHVPMLERPIAFNEVLSEFVLAEETSRQQAPAA